MKVLWSVPKFWRVFSPIESMRLRRDWFSRTTKSTTVRVLMLPPRNLSQRAMKWSGDVVKYESVYFILISCRVSRRGIQFEKVLGESTLKDRREAISLRFAQKSAKHPKMKHLFKLKNRRTRKGNMFVQTKLKGLRGYNEPINYFTRLLNNQTSTK